MASPFQNIGIGGSVNIRSLKLIDILQKKGKTVFDHFRDITQFESFLLFDINKF